MPLGFPRALFSSASVVDETVARFQGINAGGESIDEFLTSNIDKDELGIMPSTGRHRSEGNTGTGVFEVTDGTLPTNRGWQYLPMDSGTYLVELTEVGDLNNFTIADGQTAICRVLAGAPATTEAGLVRILESPNYTLPVINITLFQPNPIGGVPQDVEVQSVTTSGYSLATSVNSPTFPLNLGTARFGDPLTDDAVVSTVNYTGSATESFRTNFGIYSRFLGLTSPGLNGAGKVTLTFKNI